MTPEMTTFLNSQTVNQDEFPLAEMKDALTNPNLSQTGFLSEVEREFERAISIAMEKRIESFPVITIANQLQALAGYAIAYSHESDEDKKKYLLVSMLQNVRQMWQISRAVTSPSKN